VFTNDKYKSLLLPVDDTNNTVGVKERNSSRP